MDDDDDDDLIDDDEDETPQEAHNKHGKDRGGSFDSESNSNASPLLNQNKNRQMRHATTLVPDSGDSRSQNFASSDHKPKAMRGNSFPIGSSHTGKISSTKKTKLMAVQDPQVQSDVIASANDSQYSPRNVVAKMLMKKDRKIPGSVLKPHSEEITLLQSVALGQP